MAQVSPLSRIAAAALLCCGVFLSACGGGGGGSSPPTVMPPPPDPTPDTQFPVSSLSPFAAGCEGTPVAGTLYANSEVEPFVAVNPANAANLIGVWQQDRWSNGGAKGLLGASSFDGGRTWTSSMATFSRCTGGNAANGGDYERVTDPWVTIGPDAIAYQIALAFNGQTFVTGSSNAVLVSRSLDGGRSWSSPLVLISDGADNFNDKESITADPTTAGHAYAVWDRLSAAGHGPSYFTRTTNGGTAWEVARQIYDPGPTSQTINNQIVVLADGTLLMFFTQFDDAGGGNVAASFGIIRSMDKGLTWSERIVVTAVQAVGARDPENGTFVRDGTNLGAIAAGADNDLFVVWQDARFSGGVHDDIALTRSADGGITWSAPARINRDPTVAAFEPSVAVRSDGTIGVTYFDFRSNTLDPATLPTDYWITRSSDGVTWRESRVAGPFDLAIAPSSGGLFLGDYQALVAIGELFVPFYATTNNGDLANRTDIFASLMSSAGALAAQSLGAAESVMRAPTAAPLPATPELARRLSGSIARTMLRRVPGFTPPWLDRALADAP